MKLRNLTAATIALMALAAVAAPAFSGDFFSPLAGAVPAPGDNPLVEAGKYKKDCPWTIGMSHFGVNANTWTIQVAHEAQAAAARESCIAKFILLDANFDQKKQVADIEDLIAQKVDAIIVQPVTSTSADAAIEKAAAAGIPVVLHTGLVETNAFTTEIRAGGVYFGKVMGDWLVKTVGNDGKIWVLRGLAGHPEDTGRYNGLLESLKGTNIKIVAEEHGDWQYDKGKKVCETLFLNDPKVDGIWSSGADMTRACVDVFKQFGAQIPPISGEGNNGYFGQWIADGFQSVSPEYSPAQGAAGVDLAVALLRGEAGIYKHYDYNPPGLDLTMAKKLFRSDLSANVWWPSKLSEKQLLEFYGQK
jgi:ribose transport system substrate-binding protein